MSEQQLKVYKCNTCKAESAPVEDFSSLKGWATVDITGRAFPFHFCPVCRTARKMYDPAHKADVADVWTDGKVFRFYASQKKGYIFEGLYLYSGLGMGYYHSKDGWVYWCQPSVARVMAEADQVEYVYIDSFAHHSGYGYSDNKTYLRWQRFFEDKLTPTQEVVTI